MKKKNEASTSNGRLEGKRKLWVVGIASTIFIIIFLVMIIAVIPAKDALGALGMLKDYLIKAIGIFGLANGIEHLSKKSKIVNKIFRKGGRSDE